MYIYIIITIMMIIVVIIICICVCVYIWPPGDIRQSSVRVDLSYSDTIRPVHLLRVFLLRVLESNFPGDPL